jgi:hypothetical protein
MGIEPTSLSHLLQPTTPYCVHLRVFAIDRHVNPLIAFGATSTTIEPFAGDVSILVGQPPIGFHQLMNPLKYVINIGRTQILLLLFLRYHITYHRRIIRNMLGSPAKDIMTITLSFQSESNQQPTHYKCVALPVELWKRF